MFLKPTSSIPSRGDKYMSIQNKLNKTVNDLQVRKIGIVCIVLFLPIAFGEVVISQVLPNPFIAMRGFFADDTTCTIQEPLHVQKWCNVRA